MGYFGMYWTQKAIDERFFRPLYEEVLEEFDDLLKKGADAKGVLDKLKGHFSVKRIHDSLVDLLARECPDKDTRKLIENVFELLHTVEGLPMCQDYLCSWYERKKYGSSTNPSGQL